MATIATAATLVINAALGAWLGTMAFFSFVGAPRAFAVFGDRGGEYVNDVFPRYYAIGAALGVVAVLATIGRGVATDFDASLGILFALEFVAIGVAAYSRWGLIPRMEAAGENAFETHHRRTVVLNGIALLAVGLALVVSHLR